jgi:hypothetical protein
MLSGEASNTNSFDPTALEERMSTITSQQAMPDWFARNWYKLCEWSYMSSQRLLFQWARTIKI